MDNKIKELYKSITEEDLAKAVDELIEAGETGVIPNGIVREYVKKTCDAVGENVQSVHLFTTTVGLTQEAAFRWRKLIDLPCFYPIIKSNFIRTEVKPVRVAEYEIDGSFIEVCAEGQENFWSVYRVCEDPDTLEHYSECMADFATKEQAISFEKLIKQIYDDNSSNNS